MDIMSINSESGGDYTAAIQGGEYDVDEDDFIYFNPGSLYPQASLQMLLPYTHSSFRDNYLFYSNFLNIDVDDLTANVNYDIANNQRVEVSGIPINFHLRDDAVYGISFPSVDEEALLDELEITSENPIFRLSNGYMILNREDSLWLYINR